jgi:predicted nucleotidyltransferase component of viral defense system
MIYSNEAAFRMALEERLRRKSLTEGPALSGLRKTVAFDRLLARLAAGYEGRWVLKGGFALQLMLAGRARTTKDLDLHIGETRANAERLLREASVLDLEDHFSFNVAPVTPLQDGTPRFLVGARLDGRVFEEFHVDLGAGEPMIGSPVLRKVTALLAFAGIPGTTFPCYPPSQHLAEKVHALTRPRRVRDNSRSKDLVDIVLIAETSNIEARELRLSLEATFSACGTHPLPQELPAPPRAWTPEYRRLARGLDLAAATLEEGAATASRLVDPVLVDRTSGCWQPEHAQWQPRTPPPCEDLGSRAH